MFAQCIQILVMEVMLVLKSLPLCTEHCILIVDSTVSSVTTLDSMVDFSTCLIPLS